MSQHEFPSDQSPPGRPPQHLEPPAVGQLQGEIIEAEMTDPATAPAGYGGIVGGPPLLQEKHLVSRRPRRIRLPVALFFITCASTFWAGAASWDPHVLLTTDLMSVRRTIVRDWDQGLIYMVCVLAILAAHEMGHFLATVRYRIPASLPFFIPLPITPIGTMGAVIGMDGLRANRRQLFDIGIAGPLAGLVIAIPVLWVGISRLDLQGEPPGAGIKLSTPILANAFLDFLQPEGYQPSTGLIRSEEIASSQVNAFFMAGWVGFLITGLNMLPVSQLDGGHVIYTLFGKPRAHWIARGFLFVAISFVVLANAGIWCLMLLIVILLGADHPPTSDDSMPLGPLRWTLGLLSLSIPMLCFPAYGMRFVP